ncbi:MAG: leucine-rich repeat domain-containing protein [Clostridia bacterium]|nr:leucine-rich repeat domain-containing protein [Clostridia bacterium]
MNKHFKIFSAVSMAILTAACFAACSDGNGDGSSSSESTSTSWTASEGLEIAIHTSTSESFATVTGLGSCTDEIIYLPETYQGVKVTNVGNKAFMNVTSATKIVFSKNISMIDNAANSSSNAFRGCTAEVDMSLATDMWYISYNAFAYYEGTTVTLSESLRSLSNTVFQYSAITSIHIPASVTNISYNCFEGCTALEEVTFGENSQLSALGSGNGSAFASCTSLEKIVLPTGITDYGWSLFSNCTTEISWAGPITSLVGRDGNAAIFSYYKRETFVIPDTVETLGSKVFENCDCTYVVVPKSVTTIGNLAFGYYTNQYAPDELPVPYILYAGTQSEWDAIEKDGQVYYEDKTTLCFYSENPTDEGNWWHYDENGNPQVVTVQAEDDL